ncbi:MAG: YkgJ family cysteine cluster protein [Desulfurococcaceae archaeon]
MCGVCCAASPISLLPHEDVILGSLAELLGVEYRSAPGYAMYDAVSGLNLAFSYAMELVDGRCPFLDSRGLCRIHGIYKPLICRSYPYVPRHVRYNVDASSRTVFPSSEYGLSLLCPVIRRDREALERLYALGRPLDEYMPSEVEAAREMERIRRLLLYMLSELWRRGAVELSRAREGAPYENLYVFLVRFFPSLPQVLGVSRTIQRAREALSVELR